MYICSIWPDRRADSNHMSVTSLQCGMLITGIVRAPI